LCQECYVNPHPEYATLEIDFSREEDKLAALELTKRCPGVSRWKPNLVPRMVSEAEFFKNFMGYVCATADEHFNDEKTLRQFYSDIDKDDKEENTPKDTSEDAEEKSGAGKTLHTSMEQATQPTVEETISKGQVNDENTHKVQSDPQEEATGTQPFPQASLERFTAETVPFGARSSAELSQAFLNKDILFYIYKSANKNTVVYEAIKKKSGEIECLNDKTPVRPYWLMYEKSPVVEEDLNMVERNTAYGSTCQPSTGAPGEFVVTLASLADRPINVSVDGTTGKLSAKTRIQGEMDELLHVFVKTSSNWMGMPSVEYIDIVGMSREERVKK